MNKTLCPNGHFYDAERFSACPLCEPSSANMQADNSLADNQTSTTGSPSMIMCINGHVFDPSLSSTCPICGAGAERTEISAPTPGVKKVTCSNGHLYDRNKHSVCPICGASPQEENPPQTDLTTFEQHMTSPTSSPSIPENKEYQGFSEEGRNNDLSSTPDEPCSEQEVPADSLVTASDSTISPPLEIEEIPVSETPVPANPMEARIYHEKLPVAWLMGVKGPYRGTLFSCRTGRNRIGLSPSADVILSADPAIEDSIQAFLIYEPRQRQFFLQAGTGNSLVYHNGEMVFSHIVLAPYDRIQLGNTELVFVPLCGDKFTWEEG